MPTSWNEKQRDEKNRLSNERPYQKSWFMSTPLEVVTAWPFQKVKITSHRLLVWLVLWAGHL